MKKSPYDARARMAEITARRGGAPPNPDEHDRIADDALLILWEIVEDAPDAPDAGLPGMRNRFLDAIDRYRAERHRGGHRRYSNGRGGLERDPDEPEMPDRLAAAAGLTVVAG